MFQAFGHGAPYWVSAVWMALATFLAIRLVRARAPAAATATTNLSTGEG